MNKELSLVPQYIIQRGSKTLDNIISVLISILGLSLLAQITIPLPWTPVPITGQTFGVILTALICGRKRAMASILSYLTLGAIGLPIFAMGKSGLSIGPTTGYLIGMAVASFCVGFLSDLGWTQSWWKSYLASALGSIIIFTFGVIGLSLFIPTKELLMAGVVPFLPGDFIKTWLASFTAFKIHQTTTQHKRPPVSPLPRS